MRIALIAGSIIASVVLVVLVIGWSLPVKHRVTRTAVYHVAPEHLFATLTDVDHYPAWRSSVRRIERVPSSADGGAPRFREVSSNGAILYEIEDARPSQRMVTRIADRSLPFGGSWTFELQRVGDGTSLTITEDGEVYNPVFRFMGRFVFSYTKTIDTYLADLARKLDTPAARG